MDQRGGRLDSASFVGRAAELAALNETATAARDGRPGVVSIEGAAGTGKTSLLRRSIETLGPDVTIVAAHADGSTQDVPMALVGDLVEADFGAHPLAAAQALLARWSDLANGPLLVVAVEDLHWADLPSRQALAAAARRLEHERVLLVATARPEHHGHDDGWERLCADADRCRRLRLDTLTWSEVAALAAGRGVRLADAAARRLHDHTGGNPLYVSTMLSELSESALNEPGGELPAPRTLAATSIRRLAELPVSAQDLLAALAVLDRPTPLALVATVAAVEEPSTALDHALSTGFVEWSRSDPLGALAFTHRVFRAAVYENLSRSQRRTLHAAAAEVSDRATSLVHRVAAADRADDTLAAELEEAAGREQPQSGVLTSSRLWRWAADLTLDRTERERRLLSAARLPLRSDQPSIVRSFRADLEACGPSPLRDLVLGQLAWLDGDQFAAERMLLNAASSDDDDIAGEALVRLAGYQNARGRGAAALEVVERAVAMGLTDPQLERQAWAYLAVGLGQRDGAVVGLTALQQRLPGQPEIIPGHDAGLLAVRGLLDYFAGRARAAVADLGEVTGRLRSDVTRLLRRSQVHLAQSLIVVGRWDDALLSARVAIDLADDEHRLELAQAHASVASVLAARGQWTDAEDHVDQAVHAATSAGIGDARFAAKIGAAALLRARGDFAGIVAILEPLSRTWPTRPMFASESWFSLVVALQNTGDLDAAERQLDAMESWGKAHSIEMTMRVDGLRGSIAARRGDPERAAELFQRSVAAIGPDDPALDVSSIHHAYGRLLRAQGRRQQAIEQLRMAHARFDGLEASPYLDRVEEQLGLVGLPPPKTRHHRSRLQLTSREQDVVTLVARGMTNREIAADLFVSPKAVEYHLRNVFGKLGISSRRQLRDVPSLRTA